MHHRRRRSQGGTDDLDNLCTLCAAHHQWVHEHPNQSEFLGYLLRTT